MASRQGETKTYRNHEAMSMKASELVTPCAVQHCLLPSNQACRLNGYLILQLAPQPVLNPKASTANPKSSTLLRDTLTPTHTRNLKLPSSLLQRRGHIPNSSAFRFLRSWDAARTLYLKSVTSSIVLSCYTKKE